MQICNGFTSNFISCISFEDFAYGDIPMKQLQST
jgi:hypothetical protein